MRKDGCFICGVSPDSQEDAGLGWHDADEGSQQVDYSYFEERIWPSLANRVPGFEAIRPGRAWAGPYDMCLLDHNAIIGPAGPDGFHLCNGFSGHGLQQSPAVGRGLAEQISGGALCDARSERSGPCACRREPPATRAQRDLTRTGTAVQEISNTGMVAWPGSSKEQQGPRMTAHRHEDRHQNRLQVLGLTAIGVALLLGSTSGLAFDEDALPPVAPVEIERIDCPFTAPLGETPVCLMAHLPMRHGDLDPDGSLPEDAPRIGVHVTVLNNLSSSERPNPVVFLSGGPGQAGSQALAGFRRAPSNCAATAPSCWSINGVRGCRSHGWIAPRSRRRRSTATRFNDPDFDPDKAVSERFSACRDMYVADGIDLSAFDTRSAALDLRAIRKALDLPQWNLMGTSYGGRLALDAMRVDPEGVRAAVLNSPLSLASQADCRPRRRKAAHLPGNFSTIARKTISAPEPTAISTKNSPPLPPISKTARCSCSFRDPQSGELVRREVTWVNVVEVLYQHLAFSDSAMLVPRFIAELHDRGARAPVPERRRGGPHLRRRGGRHRRYAGAGAASLGQVSRGLPDRR